MYKTQGQRSGSGDTDLQVAKQLVSVWCFFSLWTLVCEVSVCL